MDFSRLVSRAEALGFEAARLGARTVPGDVAGVAEPDVDESCPRAISSLALLSSNAEINFDADRTAA
ncbi:hypothetical protein [Nocardia sp. XZ_19_385]|uniref:hypothetical protein n=1 Tax=Nocardia sp. XZ_19_385 TaxID=2769488 RepID=UPI00188F42B9|nr:hypothetical protein [Nocardia sp. XZ_19_385]